MARLRYKFNPSTLNFERISYSIRDYLFQGLRYLFAGSVIGGIGVILYASFFKDPETVRLEREIKYLKGQISSLNNDLDTLETFALNLKDKDDNVYRSIFGSDPYPEHLRKGGVGGSDRYRSLKGYESSEEIIETKKRIGRLQRMLVAQSKSFEQVFELAKAKDEMLQSIPAIQPVSNKDLKRIASGFGMRIHPIYKIARMHSGLDFTADIGAEVYATGDGVVQSIDDKLSGYGHHVVLRHGFGFETLYAHLSRAVVKPGEKVKRGQVIGYVGNSGTSTGPHLHYEVMKNGQKVNPVFYFYNDITPEQYEDLLQRAANANQSLD
ncbi:MAG: M23 family metallopeptidase [Flavobacteriales bacterium]|jgi:murein DD-endopeptidase MepM/ murein hydrolase activator NlpD